MESNRRCRAIDHARQRTKAEKQENRGGVWQPRFWEHTCEDVDEFDIRFDYIHFNPVKHGYVDWHHSSIHRWIKRGVLDPRWACGHRTPPNFQSIENESGEP